MDSRLETIQNAVRRLEQQFDNREREECLRERSFQEMQVPDLSWSPESNNRMSIASYNPSLRMSLRNLESIISSPSISRAPSMAISVEDLHSDKSMHIEDDPPSTQDEEWPLKASDPNLKDVENYRALMYETATELQPVDDSSSGPLKVSPLDPKSDGSGSNGKKDYEGNNNNSIAVLEDGRSMPPPSSKVFAETRRMYNDHRSFANVGMPRLKLPTHSAKSTGNECRDQDSPTELPQAVPSPTPRGLDFEGRESPRTDTEDFRTLSPNSSNDQNELIPCLNLKGASAELSPPAAPTPPEQPQKRSSASALSLWSKLDSMPGSTHSTRDLELMMSELKDRVEDWKGLDFALFGKLLLFDVLTVRKRNGNSKEGGFHTYLFERVLLCCRPTNPTKSKIKLRLGSSEVPGVDVTRYAPRLQLTARIFFVNITNEIPYSEGGRTVIQIFWMGDGKMESTQLLFRDKNRMKVWLHHLEKQRLATYCSWS